MANLIVQDDNGTVSGANGYIEVAWFKTYHNDRNNSFVNPSTSTNYTDDQIKAAIIHGSAYLDIRFNYVGWKRYADQPTAWPRWDAVDINDRYIRGIPLAVQQATAEYALRSLSGLLVTDPTQNTLHSGRDVRSAKRKVGPIEEEVEYENESFSMPRYPAADRILQSWGLVVRGGTTVRA